MNLSEVKDILKATVILGENTLDISIEKGVGSDLMSDLLRGQTHGALLLSGLNNVQVIRTSIIAGVSALVLVRGKKPDTAMIDMARHHSLPLLSTPFTMFTSCGRLFRGGLRGIETKASKEGGAG